MPQVTHYGGGSTFTATNSTVTSNGTYTTGSGGSGHSPNYSGSLYATLKHPIFGNYSDGLEGYYKFDDPAESSSVNNYVPYPDPLSYPSLRNNPSHLATPSPGNPYLQFANPYSLGLDGVSQWVEFNSGWVPKALTVNFWFKWSGTADGPIIYAGPDNSNWDTWSWGFSIHGGQMVVIFNVDGDISDPINVTANQWAMYTLVRSPTAGLILYINGVQIGARLFDTSTAADVVRIGKAGTTYLACGIDDVRIFSRSLSPSEITTLSQGKEMDLEHYTAPSFRGTSVLSRKPILSAVGISAVRNASASSACMSITGSAGVDNSFTDTASASLVTFGTTGMMNGNVPLRISSGTTSYVGFNLFIKQSSVITPFRTANPANPFDPFYYPQSPRFFIRGTAGIEYHAPTTSLFINGFVRNTVDAMNLVIVSKGNEGTVPFIMEGSGDGLDFTVRRTNAPLYIHGAFGINSLSRGPTLYISQGTLESTQSFPLVMQSILQRNSSLPLFLSGVTPSVISRSSPLYLFAGDFNCETMNMFVMASPIPAFMSSSNLALTGTVGLGMYKAIPLFITGYGMGESMNLVIAGSDTGGQSSLIRFTIEGGTANYQGTTPLVIQNNSNFYEDPTTSMFIKGLGENPGFNPYGESLGLHIQRGPNAGITMFMQNNDVMSNTSLFILGAPKVTGTNPMFIGGYGGDLTKNASLFMHGDVFTASNGSKTLAIPKVIGFEPGVAYLYTNGFDY